MMKYSLLVGDFQPFTNDDESFVRGILEDGGHVCIAVCFTHRSKRTPYSVEAICGIIQKRFKEEIASRDVAVVILPSIGDVIQRGKNDHK